MRKGEEGRGEMRRNNIGENEREKIGENERGEGTQGKENHG